MNVTLRQVGPGADFEASNEAGATLRLEGTPELGGTGQALRPMEALLASLAGCSAVDVVKILGQQREPLARLSVVVEGTRADAVPAVFTSIRLLFVLEGEVDSHKAARAIALSMEKYCSVAKMLEHSVQITHAIELRPRG